MIEMLDCQFLGVKELRKDLTKVLERVNDDGLDVVITHLGKPAALLICVEKYLEMREALKELSTPEYIQELIEARREIREGQGVPAEEVFKEKGL